jgi:hypothetical protein
LDSAVAAFVVAIAIAASTIAAVRIKKDNQEKRINTQKEIN